LKSDVCIDRRCGGLAECVPCLGQTSSGDVQLPEDNPAVEERLAILALRAVQLAAAKAGLGGGDSGIESGNRIGAGSGSWTPSRLWRGARGKRQRRE
jgi:hypothetical protein